MVQQAPDALAEVEDQRPISHEQIVVLADHDQFALFGLVVDEVLQLRDETRCAIDLRLDVCRHDVFSGMILPRFNFRSQTPSFGNVIIGIYSAPN